MKLSGMRSWKSFFLVFFVGVAISFICLDLFVPVANIHAAVSVPTGFQSISSSPGVKVYQKNSDFVTVVDLRYGSIVSLNGAVSGSPNPSSSVTRKSAGSFWVSAVAQNTNTKKVKALVNGTFFAIIGRDTDTSPVPIAFGLKTSYQTISYGYRPNGGLDQFAGFVKLFAFDSGRAAASFQPYNYPYSDRSVFIGGSPNVVGALSTSADKSRNSSVARTFVGLRDDDGNGVSETALFLSSSAATQSRAAGILTSFGAQSQAMLDGGGSTNLIVDGSAKISSARTLPHVIAIYSGK